MKSRSLRLFLVVLLSSSGAIAPWLASASHESGAKTCSRLLAPEPVLLELPAAPTSAAAKAPLDFREVVLRDRKLVAKTPATDEELSRQIGEFAASPESSPERTTLTGLSPASSEDIDRAEARVRSFEARRRTFTEWYRSRAPTPTGSTASS